MNVLMATNTYVPHVGGVARSVASFTAELRRRGHRVIVLAPVFEGCADDEDDVIRFPALQRYNGTDFSIPVPVPGLLARRIHDVKIDVVHAHHPFLLGDAALRVGASRDAPVVFTHHTMYEEYTHYVPGDSPALKRFAIDLVTGYCNLCDAVIAPSETVAGLLPLRGVTAPVTVIPTGVDVGTLAVGDGAAFRVRNAIPRDAIVVGHVGRLAREKNLEFLTRAVVRFMREEPRAWFLVVGSGAVEGAIREEVDEAGLAQRLVLAGVVDWNGLADAYAAMDVFAFASRTETQGLVLAEAMAAALPVVALDASGVREVLRDGENGFRVDEESIDSFAQALTLVTRCDERRVALSEGARATALLLSKEAMTERLINLYEELASRGASAKSIDDSAWSRARRTFAEELRILGNIAQAVSGAVL
ncbi:MAG: glycosyltransferase [Acidobacteria bacterium]|nr:glycosyltransferase [Acidobacteriota bacterium]